MKYKLLIIILFLFNSPATLYTFNLWCYINPVIPLFIGTFHYLKSITDYFIPASQADLKKAQREILEKITACNQEMQINTFNNINILFNTNKDELQKKIDHNIMIGSVKLDRIRKCLEESKKESSEKIKKNYLQHCEQFQHKIEVTTQNSQKQINTFVLEISNNTQSYTAKFHSYCSEIEKKLYLIQRKNKITLDDTQLLITKSNEESKKKFSQEQVGITKQIETNTQTLQKLIISLEQKIKILNEKTSTIKKGSTARQEEVAHLFERSMRLNKYYQNMNNNSSIQGPRHCLETSQQKMRENS